LLAKRVVLAKTVWTFCSFYNRSTARV